IEDNFDRVRAMVDLWGRHGRLSPDERDEATQRAIVKLWHNMVHTFQGATMGEWVNATRKLVEYACLDVQRAAARRTQHEASLDDPWADDEGAVSSPWDRQLGDLAADRVRRDDEQTEARDFVTWALAQVANERQRIVLERTLDGVPGTEIAEELGVSMQNLYQL